MGLGQARDDEKLNFKQLCAGKTVVKTVFVTDFKPSGITKFASFFMQMMLIALKLEQTS